MRYKKPPETRRSEVVNVRLTQTEKKQLEFNAIQLGLSISTLLRSYLPLNEKR